MFIFNIIENNLNVGLIINLQFEKSTIILLFTTNGQTDERPQRAYKLFYTIT